MQTINGVETHYTLDVGGGLPEVIQAGTNRYLQVGGQVLAQTVAGNWQYIHPDHLGSVRQVTDEASTVLLGQDYDPFGNGLAVYGAGSKGKVPYKNAATVCEEQDCRFFAGMMQS